LVKAEEALAIILFLIGFKGKKKPPPPIDPRIQDCLDRGGVWSPSLQKCKLPGDEPPPPREDCPPGTHRNEFGLCVPNIIVPPEGCGPKPPTTFQQGAGYWWQPATDAVGWNANVVGQRPDSSVILSTGEAFSQDVASWYKCERVTDPIRIITQFIT